MRRIVSSLLLGLTIGFAAEPGATSPAASAPANSAAKTDIVELPRFVVTDSRDLPAPESWRYAEIPGLEILSSISETNTRRFARNFQMIQQALGIVWPEVTRGAPANSTTLILCGRGDVFPSYLPAKLAADGGRTTSLFLQDKERAAIVVDYVTERFDDRPGGPASAVDIGAEPDPAAPAGALTASGAENDPFREFYQQYYRFVLRRSGGFVPVWLEEGLVQLLASIDYTKRSVAIGRLTDGAGGQRPEEFNVQLNRRPLMDLERMFARERPTLAEAPVYPAQCYAFVHLCLFGKRGTFQPGLVKLIQRAAAGPVTGHVFKECFGLGFEEMAVALRAHASYAAHHYVEYRIDQGATGLVEPDPIALREATQAEVGRIRGEAYQLAGNAGRAHTALIAPYIRGERDPRLLAALGLHERARGNDDRARPFLEAAVAAPLPQPRARLELSRLRFADAKRAAPAGEPLGREQTQAILGPLIVAAQQSPVLPEVFELMAETLAISSVKPSPHDLGRIYAGAQRFPQRLRLVYLAAALAVQHDPKNARALIDHGLAVAGKSEIARHFKALEAQLR